MHTKCCLTIAGSDSGGNAGVQADLRAFHAYKLHGCTVFAALTAQNPFAVSAIHDVPSDFVAAQLDAVLGTYDIAALKTGMLSDPKVIAVISEKLRAFPEIKKVIDPVMVATSGAHLIGPNAIEALKRFLLPHATLITPNLPEAEVLSNRPIKNPADVEDAAKALFDAYGAAILIKGGHASLKGESADILFDGVSFSSFTLPRIENPISTHGTGCSLAAALTAELTLGHTLREAVAGAKDYVYNAIRNSYYVGEKCGVLGFVSR